MTEFTIRIADRTVRVQALFETTRDYCRDYLGIGNEHLLLINRNDSFTDIFMADSPLLSPDSAS